MAYWKSAGITYLQYVNATTTALRQSIKPSLISKYSMREDVHYKKQTWNAGKAGEKIYFTGSLTNPVQGYENNLGHIAPDAVLAKTQKN